MHVSLLRKLLLTLAVLTTQVAAGSDASGPELRILVTYANAATGRSALNAMPGRSFRYRARYQVSPAVRRSAAAVAADYQLETLDAWPIESLKVYCVVYKSADVKSVAELVRKLTADPRVESAQKMRTFKGMTVGTGPYDDSYADLQHGLKSMNIHEAHQIALGSGVKIAVVDTGIDLKHEDFVGGEIRTRNFVSSDQGPTSTAHGTAVVSLIAANPNNGKGIVGIAPGANLVALSACWGSGLADNAATCNSFTLARALDFLVGAPPDLINLSIAGPYDALLGRLIARAQQNGTVIVAALPAAVGNEAIYPASYPGVLAIGTAQAHPKYNGLSAPGEQIMVALPDNSYDFRSGSSLAAANATGVIALLLELAPELASGRIAEILQKSQLDGDSTGSVINACRALAEIDTVQTCP